VDYFGPEPATVLTMALFRNGGDRDELGGIMCQGSRTCVSVPFPYLERRVGADDLNAAITGDTSGQPLIVFGYSQGARVVSEWLDEHAGTEGVPSPGELSFVLIGNPGRNHGGAHVIWGQPTPDTEYEVLDVARQYDLTADRPDHFQLLAIMNAYAGLVQLHGHYEDVDIYDPANYVWNQGKTTYVFVPTDDIPLLNSLRQLGFTKLADKLNDPLKARIEKAYDRSYLPAAPGWPTPAEPQPQAPETDPAPSDPPTDPAPAAARTIRPVQPAATEKPADRNSAADADTAVDDKAETAGAGNADTAGDAPESGRQTHKLWHKKARGESRTGAAAGALSKHSSAAASSSGGGNTSGAAD
jgi:hypothetical protein